MGKLTAGLVGMLALVALAAALMPGAASATGNRKLVEGTVYDTTCAATCLPECPPPPCGPVPAPAQTAIVCAQQRMIVCPLYGRSDLGTSPRICLPSSNCGGYPIYTGEGAVVNVRRRGSATVLATLPVVEGHFEIRLGRGEYVFHPYPPEEPCWSGEPFRVKVFPGEQGPIPLSLDVSNHCVAHPGAQ